MPDHTVVLLFGISTVKSIVSIVSKDISFTSQTRIISGNPFQEELQRHIETGVAQTFQFLKSAEYAKILENTNPVDQSNATKDKTLKKSRKGQKK